MSVQRAKTSLVVAALLLTCGCGDGKDGVRDGAEDAGADAATGMAADGSVQYRGVTQGGRVPDAPEYVAPDPDDGPFEVNATCCDRVLEFDALQGETEAVLEADFDVLDGVALTLSGGKFRTEQCLPESTAIQYHLLVTSESDAGMVEHPRIDPDKPHFEDAESELWNVYVLESCD